MNKLILWLAAAVLATLPYSATAQSAESGATLRGDPGVVYVPLPSGQVLRIPAGIAVDPTTAAALPSPAKPTFVASGLAYAAYATPSDMICISGAPGKVVRVTSFVTQANATAATLEKFYWVRRSAVDTGGTSSTGTAVSMDSANAASAAVVTLYTAAPSTGTLVGTVAQAVTTASAPTSAGGVATLNSPNAHDVARVAGDYRQPVTLRTVESLCLNFNGQAWPSGGVMDWLVEWTESAT